MNDGLSVDGLRFAFGAKPALDGVSFALRPGFTALLGPNGAGKSTLFNLLTRLYVARDGVITIAGHDLSTAPLKALGAMGIVFQSSTLDLDLTVRQNLRYFGALQGLSRRETDLRAQAALERLSMADRAGERVRDLNGGHRRRTEIARALLHNPAVLLLDEPTVGLDAASRTEITAHVHDLAREGKTVLWATHLADEIAPDDHLLILHRGRILADGVARDITGPQSLTERFLDLTGAPA